MVTEFGPFVTASMGFAALAIAYAGLCATMTRDSNSAEARTTLVHFIALVPYVLGQPFIVISTAVIAWFATPTGKWFQIVHLIVVHVALVFWFIELLLITVGISRIARIYVVTKPDDIAIPSKPLPELININS